MQCPVCHNPLKKHVVKGRELSACMECDGLWLPGGELNLLVGDWVEDDLLTHGGAATECRYCGRAIDGTERCGNCGNEAKIGCPAGHGTMGVTWLSMEAVDIELDHCSACRGTWIDSHERQFFGRTENDARPRDFVPRAQLGRKKRGRSGDSESNWWYVGEMFSELLWWL